MCGLLVVLVAKRRASKGDIVRRASTRIRLTVLSDLVEIFSLRQIFFKTAFIVDVNTKAPPIELVVVANWSSVHYPCECNLLVMGCLAAAW